MKGSEGRLGGSKEDEGGKEDRKADWEKEREEGWEE